MDSKTEDFIRLNNRDFITRFKTELEIIWCLFASLVSAHHKDLRPFSIENDVIDTTIKSFIERLSIMKSLREYPNWELELEVYLSGIMG